VQPVEETCQNTIQKVHPRNRTNEGESVVRKNRTRETQRGKRKSNKGATDVQRNLHVQAPAPADIDPALRFKKITTRLCKEGDGDPVYEDLFAGFLEFMEALAASEKLPPAEYPWGVTSDGGQKHIILRRRKWHTDVDNTEAEKNLIRLGAVFESKLSIRAKKFLDACSLEGNAGFKLVGDSNALWVLVALPGQKCQKMHQDVKYRGTAGKFLMLKRGLQTQYVEPLEERSDEIPTRWDTKKVKKRTLVPGDMYGFPLDWPHRGPCHEAKYIYIHICIYIHINIYRYT
jgi:hypothetical protein